MGRPVGFWAALLRCDGLRSAQRRFADSFATLIESQVQSALEAQKHRTTELLLAGAVIGILAFGATLVVVGLAMTWFW